MTITINRPMNDWDRDRFIFGITKELMIKYREEGYLSYLYPMLLKVTTSDSDKKTFNNYIIGIYDTDMMTKTKKILNGIGMPIKGNTTPAGRHIDDINENAIRTTIQSCMWLVAEKFPNEWTYETFITENRDKKLDQILTIPH